MSGWADMVALATNNYYLMASIFGIGLACSMKDKKIALYFFILSCDLVYTTLIHGQVRALDPDKLYRYLFWSFSEFLLLSVILYFAFVKEQIHRSMALQLSVLITFSIFAQLYRVIDRHIADLPYAYEVITTLPSASNVLRVLVGYAPLTVLLIRFFKRIFHGYFSGGRGDDSFHAYGNNSGSNYGKAPKK